MPDRVIRDELLESRWLDLDSSDLKVAFVVLLLTVDDFGNVEANEMRLRRLWRDHGCRSGEQAEQWLKALCDLDLCRTYEVDGKRLIHIPRFRQRVRHVKRVFPLSPWNEAVDNLPGVESDQWATPKTTDESPQTADVRRPKRSEEKRKGSSSKVVSGLDISNLPKSAAREKSPRAGGRRHKAAKKQNPKGNGAVPFIDHWWEDEQRTREMAALVEVPNVGTESWADWRHRIFARIRDLERTT